MNLTEYSKQVHEANVKKGFYDEHVNVISALQDMHNSTKPNIIKSYVTAFIDQRVALVHSELSEALEANRKNLYADLHILTDLPATPTNEYFKEIFELHIKDTVEDEIADSVIRLFDLSGFLGIDLETHVRAKLRYNSLRPQKHGKLY